MSGGKISWKIFLSRIYFNMYFFKVTNISRYFVSGRVKLELRSSTTNFTVQLTVDR
jgi:hypothetical protein